MQEANGQQLDKNPPTAGKDEVVSKLSKSNKESSTNISKWHPWILLKGNKRFSWTYFLNTRWKLPPSYSIAGSRPLLSIWYFLSYRWDSCQPYFPRSCQYYFLHRQRHKDQILSIIIIYSIVITFNKSESHPNRWTTYSNQEKITLVVNWHTPSSLSGQTKQTPATHIQNSSKSISLYRCL